MAMRSMISILLFVAPLSAQTVHPGIGVRVLAPTVMFERMEGVFLGRNGDTLLFGNETRGPVAVPSAAVTQLQVAAGKSRLRGALRGALWGGGTIAALMALAGSTEVSASGDTTTRGEWIVQGAASGALIGAIVGAFVPVRVWKTADPRILLSAAPRKSIGVRFVLRD
jgi:hypothetical protein